MTYKEHSMRQGSKREVGLCMTREVRLIAPAQTIQEAAELMVDCDAGAIPVGDKGRLVGMITDRDIATRAVAGGLGPDTPVSKIMSKGVKYCFEDEDAEHVASNMGDIRVRRLVVLSRDKQLVGIVALGDLACGDHDPSAIAGALGGISRRGPVQQETT